MAAKSSYSASDLVVLEGLEAVRLRPGMYVGSTGSRGLHHLVWEIMDNAMDEALSGYANKVEVTIHKDNSITITDNGRGVPVDINEKTGLTGVELIYTVLHAGGKFNSDNYSFSGGLHGVGAAVVNALSEYLVVEVKRDGFIWRQRFESRLNKKTGKIDAGKPVTSLEQVATTNRTGTSVTFKPDSRIFTSTTEFDRDTIRTRVMEYAYLNKGIKLTLTDERGEAAVTNEFCFENGLMDFIGYANEGKTLLHSDIIHIEGENAGIYCELVMQYTDGYSSNEVLLSFVNNIHTMDGGPHETGLRTGITKVMNEFAERLGYTDDKKNAVMTGEDYRAGLTSVLSVRMKNPQFEGQTKERLGNPEVKPAIEGIVVQQLTEYFSRRESEDFLRTVLNKAQTEAKSREAAKKARDMTRMNKSLDAEPLVGKLASCTGKNRERNELFIVEGDSAGGSAKQGRDRSFQAILPLRGKPLNVEKTRLQQMLANEEYRTLITALGTGIGEDFNINNLRYDRVIILSDADQDGAHIRAILMTFFFRYMRELVAQGHLYIGLAPLYRVAKGKESKYCYSDDELKAETSRLRSGYTIQRYKGLGEMDPEQLWETTMDPAARHILRVDIDDLTAADRMISILMGEQTDRRKQYIAENADFNKKDLFEQMEGSKRK